MGEEQKEGGENKGEVKEEEPAEVVLKVDMHCEGCARKVERSLRKFEGVEEVKTESKLRRVVVTGKGVDPIKLCERVQKKTGRKAEVISPMPKPPEEDQEKKEDAPPPQEENKEEAKPITVVLKVRMHCEACAQVLQKQIKKIEVQYACCLEMAIPLVTSFVAAETFNNLAATFADAVLI